MRQALLKRGWPVVPALCVREDSGETRLFESWSPRGGARLSPPAASFHQVHDWAELTRTVKRCLDRSLIGRPEWISVSRHVLRRTGAPAGKGNSSDGHGAPTREFALRLLAVAATQPLLCVDWPGDFRVSRGRDEVSDLVRRSLLLHDAFARLGESLSAHESEGHLPLWRHLFVAYPSDAVAWRLRDQWLFGPDLMVAPVLTENTVRRVVHFPPGEWVDLRRSGQRRVIRGPKFELIDIPPGSIGLFERQGARWGLRAYLPKTW